MTSYRSHSTSIHLIEGIITKKLDEKMVEKHPNFLNFGVEKVVEAEFSGVEFGYVSIKLGEKVKTREDLANEIYKAWEENYFNDSIFPRSWKSSSRSILSNNVSKLVERAFSNEIGAERELNKLVYLCLHKKIRNLLLKRFDILHRIRKYLVKWKVKVVCEPVSLTNRAQHVLHLLQNLCFHEDQNIRNSVLKERQIISKLFLSILQLDTTNKTEFPSNSEMYRQLISSTQKAVFMTIELINRLFAKSVTEICDFQKVDRYLRSKERNIYKKFSVEKFVNVVKWMVSYNHTDAGIMASFYRTIVLMSFSNTLDIRRKYYLPMVNNETLNLGCKIFNKYYEEKLVPHKPLLMDDEMRRVLYSVDTKLKEMISKVDWDGLQNHVEDLEMDVLPYHILQFFALSCCQTVGKATEVFLTCRKKNIFRACLDIIDRYPRNYQSRYASFRLFGGLVRFVRHSRAKQYLYQLLFPKLKEEWLKKSFFDGRLGIREFNELVIILGGLVGDKSIKIEMISKLGSELFYVVERVFSVFESAVKQDESLGIVNSSFISLLRHVFLLLSVMPTRSNVEKYRSFLFNNSGKNMKSILDMFYKTPIRVKSNIVAFLMGIFKELQVQFRAFFIPRSYTQGDPYNFNRFQWECARIVTRFQREGTVDQNADVVMNFSMGIMKMHEYLEGRENLERIARNSGKDGSIPTLRNENLFDQDEVEGGNHHVTWGESGGKVPIGVGKDGKEIYKKAPKKAPRICKCCKEAVEKLMRCSRCQSTWYCSVECQKRDWKIHKGVCRKI